MGFGEVVSFSIMKVSECVSVLTLISWDKNTECHGHCQVFVREKLLYIRGSQTLSARHDKRGSGVVDIIY